MKNKHVDAVVIGAGAGAGVVAKELSTSGLSVVLFERGGWASYDDHAHDELHSQRTTVLGNAYGPDDERYRRVFVGQDGNEQVVLPSEGLYNNNAACVGSGTVSYGAMGWRFMEEDFKMRSTYGHVEGSTLEDWPISYSDLEPYYEKDVLTMNTTFANPESENDIHWVSCNDCHSNDKKSVLFK